MLDLPASSAALFSDFDERSSHFQQLHHQVRAHSSHPGLRVRGLERTGEPEDFYIVPGADIAEDPQAFFGSSFVYEDRQAINRGALKRYRDNWKLFDAAA
jgi:hypothetical protein